MSSPTAGLADTMRYLNSIGRYEEAAKYWHDRHDPGTSWGAPVRLRDLNVEELFQLFVSLMSSGYLQYALRVLRSSPGLLLEEIGGDVVRIFGIGTLLQGDTEAAAINAEVAFDVHKRLEIRAKLPLDLVALVRANLALRETVAARKNIEQAASLVVRVLRSDSGPARQVDYWRILVDTIVGPRVDSETHKKFVRNVMAEEVSPSRRKALKRLLESRDPVKTAWKIVREENTPPRIGLYQRLMGHKDLPWGWFSYPFPE